MLQDQVRNRAFKEAILRTVKQGDVVIDLGTGTGILAIWAAQAGAKRVYAIEETDVAEVAEAVIKDNGFENVITVLKANSSEVTLQEQADVLIAEIVGHFLFEEGIVEAIAEVREVLLKPNARIIPNSASVLAAPVELDEAFEEIKFWDSWKNPSLSAVKEKAASSAYVETVSAEAVRSKPEKLFDIDFNSIKPERMMSETTFTLDQDCSIDAIAGWFKLHLDNDSCIHTSPWSAQTHWQQCVFPLTAPFELAKFDTVKFCISLESFSPGAKWLWELSTTDSRYREVHSFAITYGPGSRLLAERF